MRLIGVCVGVGGTVVEIGAEVEFSIVRSIELWIGEALIP